MIYIWMGLNVLTLVLLAGCFNYARKMKVELIESQDCEAKCSEMWRIYYKKECEKGKAELLDLSNRTAWEASGIKVENATLRYATRVRDLGEARAGLLSRKGELRHLRDNNMLLCKQVDGCKESWTMSEIQKKMVAALEDSARNARLYNALGTYFGLSDSQAMLITHALTHALLHGQSVGLARPGEPVLTAIQEYMEYGIDYYRRAAAEVERRREEERKAYESKMFTDMRMGDTKIQLSITYETKRSKAWQDKPLKHTTVRIAVSYGPDEMIIVEGLAIKNNVDIDNPELAVKLAANRACQKLGKRLGWTQDQIGFYYERVEPNLEW